MMDDILEPLRVSDSHIMIQVKEVSADAKKIHTALSDISTTIGDYVTRPALGPHDAKYLLTVQNEIIGHYDTLKKNTELMLSLACPKPPPEGLPMKCDLPSESSDEESDAENDKTAVIGLPSDPNVKVNLAEEIDEYGLTRKERQGLAAFRKNLQDTYQKMMDELHACEEELKQVSDENRKLCERVGSSNAAPAYEWKLKLSAQVPKVKPSASAPVLNNPETEKVAPAENEKPGKVEDRDHPEKDLKKGSCKCR